MTTRVRSWLSLSVLVAALLWAYWTVLREMAERWFDDPQYSHGYLVPIFSAYLLWARRDRIRNVRPVPSWWGVVLLLAGVALWGAGALLFVNWFTALSLLLALAGLAVAWGGWPALRWSWPAVAFLGFMIPLPFRFQTALGGELQRLATLMSTYALQTFGAPAISEGNLILLNDVKIGIVEACSGLGMMVTFFAISVAVAMLLQSKEWWLRLILVLSAVPVAVLANVARITITGLLYNAAQDRLARIVFHDAAGLLMMPLAVAVLFGEMYLLERLIVNRPSDSGPRGWQFAWSPR